MALRFLAGFLLSGVAGCSHDGCDRLAPMAVILVVGGILQYQPCASGGLRGSSFCYFNEAVYGEAGKSHGNFHAAGLLQGFQMANRRPEA